MRVNYKLDLSITPEALAKNASNVISEQIKISLSESDRAKIVLSGGSTPFATYKLLGLESLPWENVDVFLGDERWVDPESELSNALMLRNSLLLNSPGSKACFHPVPTTAYSSPEESAVAYEDILKQKYLNKFPFFDLMLLGLGDDGHTASLFPESDSLKVDDKLTTVGRGKGQERITFTYPLLSSAKKIIFLVSGNTKKTALKRLLDPNEDPSRTPAKLVKTNSDILILADKESACLI